MRDKKTFKEQCGLFLNFIKNDTLIIHNSGFDVGFINNELSLAGMPKLTNPVIDTVALARKTLNTRVANLDYLCRRFKVDLSERNLHGALLDSRLLAEVYLELKGGKQFSMNLSKKPQTNSDKVDIKENGLKKIIKIYPSEKEILLHKKMVDNIKEPFWKKYNY